MTQSERVRGSFEASQRAQHLLDCLIDNHWMTIDCGSGNEWARDELEELRWLGLPDKTRVER